MRTVSVVATLLLMSMSAQAEQPLAAAEQAQAAIERGDSLTAWGRLAEAFEQYRRACELDPGAAMAFRGAGFVLLESGDPLGAIPYLKDAARIDPAAHRPVENLGLAHLAVDEDIRAELMRLALLNREGGIVDLQSPEEIHKRRLIETLHSRDWYAEGIQYLRDAVRMAPTESKYWYNLGTFLQKRSHDPREAAEALLKAVELDQEYYPALRNLALLLVKQGHLDEARSIASKIEGKSQVEDPFVPDLRAWIAGKEEDHAEAVKQYLRVLKLSGGSFRIHLQLAVAYRRLGDLEHSQEHTDKAIAFDPDSAESIRREVLRFPQGNP